MAVPDPSGPILLQLSATTRAKLLHLIRRNEARLQRCGAGLRRRGPGQMVGNGWRCWPFDGAVNQPEKEASVCMLP
jgi:hypothetical protein